MGGRTSRLRTIRRRVTKSPAFVGFLAWVASLFLRLYARTLRITVDTHPDAAPLYPEKALYAFWHGRQFLLAPSFRHQGILVMTSMSWAGSIQAAIMTRLGYPVVRGSSGRRAAKALADAKRGIESGCSAAIAVDGPSGPIHRSKPGILYLAEKLGYPIVPVATSARPAWVIPGTWCRYLLPAPFSRCHIGLGEPLMSAARGELTSEELDSVLERWTAEVDRRVGREPAAAKEAGAE